MCIHIIYIDLNKIDLTFELNFFKKVLENSMSEQGTTLRNSFLN